MVRNLVEAGAAGSYVSLTDPSTRAAAEADIRSWLAARILPAVVDEVQLVPDLTLAMTSIVELGRW